ncbi:MAG: adenylosuccinate lyase family protein [Desulfurivibrionaceae bacterium]|nr:adenylosuccinate lyase family protein [Desulfobulbales bacterium]MDT8334353.1 adenylosuccinate lyase family protein [Desulfurivibrionaceae bacterium]
MDCCQTPRGHITDSRYYSRGYTTLEARMVFCDQRRLQRWLDVEAALVISQTALGMIPAEISERLRDTAKLDLFDCEAIRTGIAETGHSLIPLLDEWQKTAGPEAARFIHYGATTQDIQDTAQSLEIRDIIFIVERDLGLIIEELAKLTTSHRRRVIIGRTHGQHALPTTLGLKIAVWLDEMLRHAERLQQCRRRLLVSQLFGGVGTMAALGDRQQELLEDFSCRLGLAAPNTAWHTARDRIAEFLSCLGMLTGTMAKIANEIYQLAKNETGELEEPFHMGKIGSTTMPHKRNPELCEQVVVLARLVKAAAGLGFDGLINEHERDYRAVRLEWAGLVDASLYSCGALELLKNILKGLIVHPERINRNLDSSACLISTEALMFIIGDKIGKPAAHKLLYEISMEAYGSGVPLSELLSRHPMVKSSITESEIRAAVDPAAHIGSAVEQADRIAGLAEEWLAENRPAAKAPAPCPLAGNGRCGMTNRAIEKS